MLYTKIAETTTGILFIIIITLIMTHFESLNALTTLKVRPNISDMVKK